MLSKVLVDEVLMHYFEKVSQLLGLHPKTPTGALPLDPADPISAPPNYVYIWVCFSNQSGVVRNGYRVLGRDGRSRN